MCSPPSPFRLTAFGLQIDSELVLPELLAGDVTQAAPDVSIRFGPVPDNLPGALASGVRYQGTADALRLQVDGVAVYLVEQGRNITIQRDAAANDDDVRVFLLGSAFGALLHQRGDLVLHGSAINWEGKAVVFMGRSGIGKSTTATAFRQRGHAVLTDDLCVIRPDPNGTLLAYPGFPQTKLWLDSLAKLEFSPEGLRRIRHKLEKRALPLAGSFDSRPLPVHQLFLLNTNNLPEVKIRPTAGPRKFAILKNNTYRFGFLAGITAKATHFTTGLKLAQACPLSVITRPKGIFLLDELLDAVTAELTAPAS